jgi:omega-amidase
MKVGLAQIECSVGGIEKNCAKLEHFSQQASEQKCDVIIFPEMMDTGYVPEVMIEKGSSWDGLPFQTAQRCASKFAIHVVCGISEREGNHLFNSLAIISPTGELLGRYRKIHLFTPDPIHEEQIFSPGTEITQLAIKQLMWGFTICYDIRFPEIYRLLALHGVQVLVNATAWPLVREKHWDILTRARAIENQAYFLGVNRVGNDNGFRFCGRSRIVDPLGEVVAEASSESEELLVGDIQPEKIHKVRSKLPVFDDRRADLYGNLEKT